MAAPIVTLSQGKLSGLAVPFATNVVYTYEDIPFAKTPRFKKPEDYGEWQGIWDGTNMTRSQVPT